MWAGFYTTSADSWIRIDPLSTDPAIQAPCAGFGPCWPGRKCWDLPRDATLAAVEENSTWGRSLAVKFGNFPPELGVLTGSEAWVKLGFIPSLEKSYPRVRNPWNGLRVCFIHFLPNSSALRSEMRPSSEPKQGLG